MARRRTKRRSSRSRGFSSINAAEALAYANIMTEGLFNANVGEFVLGSRGGTSMVGVVGGYGGSAWGLAELINDPSLFSNVAARAKYNAWSMAIQSATVGVGFWMFKKLLRRPISNVNRNIFTPLLGKGVVRL